MCEKYIRHTLQIPDIYPLPVHLLEYFDSIAAGNPKSIEELISQLKRHNAIAIDSCGRVTLTCDDLSQVPLPSKILGYTRASIDRFQVRTCVSYFPSLCFGLTILVFMIVSLDMSRSGISLL